MNLFFVVFILIDTIDTYHEHSEHVSEVLKLVFCSAFCTNFHNTVII